MVDVQHGALRALEEDRFALLESAVHKLGGVADVGANFVAEAQRFFDFMRKIDVRAVGSFCEAVFFVDNARGFFAE